MVMNLQLPRAGRIMNSTLMSNKLGSDAKEPLAGRWAGTGEFKKQPALAWHYQGEGKFWRKFWFTGFRGLVVAVPTIMGMALGLWIDTL